MTPTFGGAAIFGVATSVSHVPNATAAQEAAFFGIQGVQSLFGGTRGRAFEVSGVLSGDSPAGCVAAEILLLSYADGIARTLIDTTGTAWPSVVFHGQYQRTGPFAVAGGNNGWILPFRCILRGLV